MALIRVKDLRGLREQRGLSLKGAAEKLNISETTLSRIELGTYDNETRHEIVINYIRLLKLCPVKQKEAPSTSKPVKRKEPMKYTSHIEHVSPEEGIKLGQWRLKLGVQKKYAAQLLGLSTNSITNKERGAYLFTRKEYDTLKAVYEEEEKISGRSKKQ